MIDVGKADEQEEIARHEELWTLQGRIVRGLNKRMMVTVTWIAQIIWLNAI